MRGNNYVKNYIGVTTPGAAIVIVKNDKIIFSKGYGCADLENKIPVNPQRTIFEYGSISKLFVWTSIMQLVEQGKLDLDTDARNYLPEEINKTLVKFKHSFTIRELMNYVAGLVIYLIFLPIFRYIK
ncbi:serine hydrolase domain-containing protein [Leadbettera azotonutricia]|uniref:Beta-lactamase n=1 Tax=Leadbettera azotonutricia (strain ATCC BAA-888 / DSM 13862 / ZAS-9) TaxID=545695 RepID=F5YCP1_LEAAZ|nr:serine hydrolase domain-containing protein [Leadbettera azotonutricia]AEF82975.1 beta-lactamase [Leadbettera azotonutricia ZAS-9]